VPHIFGCDWDEINGLVSYYGSMLNKGYTPIVGRLLSFELVTNSSIDNLPGQLLNFLITG